MTFRPTEYATREECEAAIRAKIAAGRCVSGEAVVNFSGAGGATVYRAHVRHESGMTCCI